MPRKSTRLTPEATPRSSATLSSEPGKERERQNHDDQTASQRIAYFSRSCRRRNSSTMNAEEQQAGQPGDDGELHATFHGAAGAGESERVDQTLCHSGSGGSPAAAQRPCPSTLYAGRRRRDAEPVAGGRVGPAPGRDRPREHGAGQPVPGRRPARCRGRRPARRVPASAASAERDEPVGRARRSRSAGRAGRRRRRRSRAGWPAAASWSRSSARARRTARPCARRTRRPAAVAHRLFAGQLAAAVGVDRARSGRPPGTGVAASPAKT